MYSWIQEGIQFISHVPHRTKWRSLAIRATRNTLVLKPLLLMKLKLMWVFLHAAPSPTFICFYLYISPNRHWRWLKQLRDATTTSSGYTVFLRSATQISFYRRCLRKLSQATSPKIWSRVVSPSWSSGWIGLVPIPSLVSVRPSYTSSSPMRPSGSRASEKQRTTIWRGFNGWIQLKFQ